MTGLKGTQRAGKALLLGVSIRVFSEETGICICVLNEDLPSPVSVGTIQSVKGPHRTKRQGENEFSLSSETGSSIFYCPWASELQFLEASDSALTPAPAHTSASQGFALSLIYISNLRWPIMGLCKSVPTINSLLCIYIHLDDSVSLRTLANIEK